MESNNLYFYFVSGEPDVTEKFFHHYSSIINTEEYYIIRESKIDSYKDLKITLDFFIEQINNDKNFKYKCVIIEMCKHRDRLQELLIYVTKQKINLKVETKILFLNKDTDPDIQSTEDHKIFPEPKRGMTQKIKKVPIDQVDKDSLEDMFTDEFEQLDINIDRIGLVSDILNASFDEEGFMRSSTLPTSIREKFGTVVEKLLDKIDKSIDES